MKAAMSSDPFELLGLNPRTATDADVRRAYAERLKVTRPEDDRAGFMALRQAFEQARERVRWRGDDFEDEDEAAAEQPIDAAPQAPVVVDVQAVLAQADEDEDDEDDGYDYQPSAEEAAYDARITRTMDALVDVLTGSPFGPAPARVLSVIDDDAVSGIEEYQTMQWRVRQFLCDRTGMFLDPPQQRVPDWLTLPVFDALDQYYGWTRQPVTNAYVRQLNDWMAGLRRTMAAPLKSKADHRREALAELSAGPDTSKGSSKWLWIGAGILIFQVVRVLGGLGG
jgi:hypothetical protein